MPVTTTIEPARSLQLCSKVPVSEKAIMGDDPAGGELDPIFQGVLLTYAQEHDDTFGGLWLDREAYGTVVLAFDRPIGEWGIAFDVVQVGFTEAELVRRTIDISEVLNGLGLESFGVGADIMRNRVSVVPAQLPTGEEVSTMAAALEVVVPLEVVCLEGTIVDARPDPIAPGTPLDVTVLPDANGMHPPDTEVECNGVQLALADLQSLTPIEEADTGLKAVFDGWIWAGSSGGGGAPAAVVLDGDAPVPGWQALEVHGVHHGRASVGSSRSRWAHGAPAWGRESTPGRRL